MKQRLNYKLHAPKIKFEDIFNEKSTLAEWDGELKLPKYKLHFPQEKQKIEPPTITELFLDERCSVLIAFTIVGLIGPLLALILWDIRFLLAYLPATLGSGGAWLILWAAYSLVYQE